MSGYDSSLIFTDNAIEVTLINMKSLSDLKVCVSTCRVSIAHVVLWNQAHNIKYAEEIFRKPELEQVYAYFPLVTYNPNEHFIYDLGPTKTPKS